jgi:uncharacterized HAD superfamily protein
MRPLKIGVDVDDVVADCAAPYLRAFATEFGLDLGDKELGWHLLDALEVPASDKEEFRVRLYGGPFFAELDCYTDCANAIERLATAGHAVHFITARSERRRAVTEEWLARHGLLRFAQGVHLRPTGDFVPRAYDVKGSAAYKVDRALSLGLDCFCEDDPVVSSELARAGVRVFMFDRPWNADLDHPSVVRVRGWEDVVRDLVSS